MDSAVTARVSGAAKDTRYDQADSDGYYWQSFGVNAAPGDTVQSLAQRMAYRDFKLDRFLALNNLQANSRLQPGSKVKLVTLGRRSA